MVRTDRVLTLILAGGKGERLEPLTRLRAKPAVPFGGIYRIVDMTLSNCINSGLRKVVVLTQYLSRSLEHHLREAWRFISRPSLGEYIEPLPAEFRTGEDWYRGTADALLQNKRTIEDADVDVLLVLAGDHIYKMDYRLMLELLDRNKASMVVAVVEVQAKDASSFGIVEVNSDYEVTGFQEKPEAPTPIPGRPGMALASMGIYAFDPKMLFKVLEEDAVDPESRHDIGRDIVRRMMRAGKVMAFPFVDENRKESKYWRDVGTIDAYFDANMDLVDVDPLFNLYDQHWPLYTRQPLAPPPKFVFAEEAPGGRNGLALNALVSAGCIIAGGQVRNSVLSPFVRVSSYADVRETILFEDVVIGRHAKIRRAIIDKNVRVPEGTIIGYDAEADKKRFYVSPRGIVVIPKGEVLQ